MAPIWAVGGEKESRADDVKPPRAREFSASDREFSAARRQRTYFLTSSAVFVTALPAALTSLPTPETVLHAATSRAVATAAKTSNLRMGVSLSMEVDFTLRV